jgi:5-(carboxyamino)imidazole ribonucleotide synthase
VTRAIGPGAALGVLGGGQLGRMFALAARRMGYRVHVFSPEGDSPAGQVADAEVCASWDDLDALRTFARAVEVVTFEFENVPAEAVSAIEALTLVRPSGVALHLTQQRVREKTFLADHGFPTVRFASAASIEELHGAVAAVGTPAVVKTAAFGYDGKGQHKLLAPSGVEHVWQTLGHQPVIVEQFVNLQAEISVVAARGPDGQAVAYRPFENRHVNHILDLTTAPAAVDPAVAARARDVATAIMDELSYVGVLCVEFFVTTDGELLVNELAPRPHNSGHLTIDAAATSQFEQQVRAVCGLPLGSPELIQPAAMANLLGDLWSHGEPNWAAALALPDVRLHLYGKGEARPGRKMGHLTALGRTAQHAQERVIAARDALLS